MTKKQDKLKELINDIDRDFLPTEVEVLINFLEVTYLKQNK